MEQKHHRPSHMLEVGDTAPDFSLMDESGKLAHLGEHRGKNNVVLIFYPGDKTPGCTKQLCAVRDQFELFTADDTVVFGVNPQDAESHKRFINKHNFPFPLLVDREKRVISAYACKGLLMTKRTVYAINKDGIIVFATRGMPSNEEILKAFKG